MQKWEYLLVQVHYSYPGGLPALVHTNGVEIINVSSKEAESGKALDLVSYFTNLGKDRWELIAISEATDPSFDREYMFKRPVE